MENKKIICTNKDGEKFDVVADQLKFRPSVYGVIAREGKVLLVRQWDGYDFPGGEINLGEKIENALVREVREETGFDVKPLWLLTIDDDFHKMTFGYSFVQSIQAYYLCDIVGGKLSKENFDVGQFEDKYMDLAEWVDLDDIGKVKLFDPVRSVKTRILDDLRRS
jgi:8-oxo-dGTP pyrophosphatase MutT (NUDIX family)